MAKETGGRCVIPHCPSCTLSQSSATHNNIASCRCRIAIRTRAFCSELTKAAQTLCDLDTLLRESSSACVPLATAATDADADADCGANTAAADSDGGSVSVSSVSALERYDASLGIDGIALVDARRVQIAAAGAALRDEAERMLWRALEATHATTTARTTTAAQTTTAPTTTTSAGTERPAGVQSAAQAAADLGTALQVFCNLGMRAFSSSLDACRHRIPCCLV